VESGVSYKTEFIGC